MYIFYLEKETKMLFKKKNCQKCDSTYDVASFTCPVCGAPNDEPGVAKLSKHIIMADWVKQVFFVLLGVVGLNVFAVLAQSIMIGVAGEEFLTTIQAKFFTNLFAYIPVVLCQLYICFPIRKNILQSFKGWKPYVFGLAAALTLIFVSYVYAIFINQYFVVTDNVNQSTAEAIIKYTPIGSIIVLGILGPIVEELTYRLGLFSFLKRINNWLPYIATIVIFALIHFDWMSIGKETIINELLNLPTYAIAGFILCLVYEKCGLSASIFAHIAYNLFVVFSNIIGQL